MDVSSLGSRFFLINLVDICFSKAERYYLTWNVEEKVLQYGEDLSICCHVENCCRESAGWGKWTSNGELTTIFIDVNNLNVDDRFKYDGGTNTGGFCLIIRNITREDINMTYSCTYGFLIGKKKVLVETDAFFEIVPGMSSNERKTIKLQIILTVSISAVAVCVVVPLVVIFYKQKQKDTHKKENNIKTDIRITSLDQEIDIECLNEGGHFSSQNERKIQGSVEQLQNSNQDLLMARYQIFLEERKRILDEVNQLDKTTCNMEEVRYKALQEVRRHILELLKDLQTIKNDTATVFQKHERRLSLVLDNQSNCSEESFKSCYSSLELCKLVYKNENNQPEFAEIHEELEQLL